MSRLDFAILRLLAQRACLESAAAAIAALPGPVFELGLGNGRTYDHLRSLLPEREIYAFDRRLSAHPDSVPPPRYLVLGEFSETLKMAVRWFSGRVALVHADICAKHPASSLRSAHMVARFAPELLQSGGYLLSDREVGGPQMEALSLPPGQPPGIYHYYRRI
jgi:hypothetical protein